MVPRRLVVRALLRASGTATALLVLYFTLPLTGSIDRSTALLLGLGLLAFAGVVTWQVRSVLRSSYPGLRAIESLAAAIPLFLVLFAALYLHIADLDGSAFSEPLSRTDALYFTITVFSTVGFGDIVPRADLARIVTMVQMLGDLLFVGLVLQLMIGAVKLGLRRRATASRRDSPIHPIRVMPARPPRLMLPSRTAPDLDWEVIGHDDHPPATRYQPARGRAGGLRDQR